MQEITMKTITIAGKEISKEYVFSYVNHRFYIPWRMMGGIKRYVENGIKPGRFLTAVICNNLMDAVGQADDENMVNLPAYISFFYNEIDLHCWGSKEKMNTWMEQKRMEADVPTPENSKIFNNTQDVNQ